MATTIYTIGHSNHSIERFLSLLEQHAIELIVDVRSNPESRWEWFSRDLLEGSLLAADIGYRWLGRELGPRRHPDEVSEAMGRVDYETIATLPLFREGLVSVEASAAKRRACLLCAEKEPLDCHRTLLIGRALADRGAELRHILADGSVEENDRTMERLIALTGVKPDLFAGADEQALLARACRLREGQISSSAGR